MNTGFIYKEREQTDFVAGAETGVAPVVNNPKKNWDVYLPIEEKQKGKFDTMACVTFSALNSLETQFALLKDTMDVSDITLLKDLGYIDDIGQLNLSDRFTAKMSGTTKQGNYLTKVWDSIRHDGVLPEKDWPFVSETFDWDEYYKDIPQELKDKAKKFLDIFDVKYEWLDLVNLKDHLKTAPIQIAVKVGNNWSLESIVKPPSSGGNHAILLYSIGKGWNIYDHYFKFKKTLHNDYPIICAMRGVLSCKEVKAPVEIKYNFEYDLSYGDKNLDVIALQDILKNLGFMSKAVTSTGYYGNITSKAVYDFQVANQVSDLDELNRLGGRIVGPKTRAKLNSMF